MFTRRPRSARELVSKAGRIPLIAAFGLLALPSFVWAQPPAAPAVRDPMKAEKAQADDKSKTKVSVSEHNTVDLHLKDEDLANVLELLSIQTQKNIVASKGVSGKVTATLYGVTFYQALDAILHVNGFGYVEQGNFIFVYTNDELKTIQAALKKRVAKEIKLNYINADDAKEFVTPLLSKDGGEIKINLKTKDFNIPDKAPVGKNDYALGDTMVVFDYEENVKAIEDLVKQLDTRPQQVLVEATILQTSLNEANAFGVDFSIIGDLNFVDFINTGGALSAAGSLIKGGTGASGQGVSPPDDRGNAFTSTVGNTTGPGGFKAGVIAGDVGIFVRMLDQITDTVILSNPKILALNRQPARVLVGKRVGYLNTTQTETSTTQSVEFLDTGTQLYFRPFVSSLGEVRMELKPQVSSAEIRTITDSGGRAVTIPDEVTQELVTNVNVRDGQTVVLGGLFTDNATFTRRQVPWMGDIPILGAAFRGNEDTTVRSEIIFLITPTIVTDTLIAGSADRALGDVERARAGMRQGLLPWSREKMTDQANVEAEQLARDGRYAEALQKIKSSLSLNANQPEAYRLREKITGMREHWSNPSLLDSYLDSEVVKRIDSVPAAPTEQPNLKPRGSVVVPMDKVSPPAPMRSEATPRAAAPQTAILVPGQANALPVTVTDAVTISAPGSNPLGTTPSNNDNGTTPATPAPTTMTNAEQHSANTPSNGSTSANPTDPAVQAMDALAQSMAMQTTTSVVAAPSTTTAASTNSSNTTDFVAPVPNAGSQASTNTTSTNTVTGVSSNVEPTAAASVKITASEKTQPTYTVPNLTAAELKTTDEVRATLPGLRGQIELYGLMNGGHTPELGNGEHNGWAELVNAQLVKAAPSNSYVGGENATKVVIGEKPDETYQTNYGWIFNPKTGQLWAAGFDAKDRPLAKSAATAAKPASKTEPAPKAEPVTAGVETDSPTK
jgi:type IV pilus assembly protein PilQ